MFRDLLTRLEAALLLSPWHEVKVERRGTCLPLVEYWNVCHMFVTILFANILIRWL